jgi:iron-sulfur cluster repair protein YtfE (RIC family)
MLHTIGRAPRNGDIVELFFECHARIRFFTGLALAVGERVDASNEDIIDGCERVERYFTVAFPRHIRDEEDSVLPRLKGRSPELDFALAKMAGEHGAHVSGLEELQKYCREVRARPTDDAARAALARVARHLSAEFEPHLKNEEELIFPAIRKFLSAEEQSEMVAELRARRADLLAPPV